MFNDMDQLCRLHHTRLAPQDLSFFKKYQGGYTLYLKLPGGRLIPVYIHFNDGYAVAHTFLYLFQYGRHGFAGAAPGGEEVDQYGFAAVYQCCEAVHFRSV